MVVGVSTHIAVLRLIAVDFDDFDFGRRKSSGRLIFLSCCLALVLIFKVGMSGKIKGVAEWTTPRLYVTHETAGKR